MKRKRRTCYLIALLMCVGVGCGENTSITQLVVYSPHGKELLSEYAEKFEAANPGVRVNWLDMGSQNILDRIRSEQTNPQADLWWGAPSSFFMSAEKEGLLEAYRPSWAAAVDSMQRSPGDFWCGNFLTPEVIAFNSQLLTRETAPQDWDDLIKPKWRDKIAIRNPLASGTMRAIYAAMIWRTYKISGSPDAGYAWLRKLDANTKSYPADPTLMYLAIARREAQVTLWNMPDIELQKKQYDYPFDYVIPKSGTPVLIEGLAIVKGGKNPEMARNFYEFITTAESYIAQAQKYYRIPARKDIAPDQLPKWMTTTEVKAMDIDWQIFSEKSPEWMKYWDGNIKDRN